MAPTRDDEFPDETTLPPDAEVLQRCTCCGVPLAWIEWGRKALVLNSTHLSPGEIETITADLRRGITFKDQAGKQRSLISQPRGKGFGR
jgi:hypothetical protein